MRAVRELRAPPRTADRESFERGIAPHPEYAGGGEAMSLLYPDRLTLKAQPGPLITIPSGGSMAAAPPAIAVAARNITDMRPAGSRSSQRHQFDAASLLYPEKAAAAAPPSSAAAFVNWQHPQALSHLRNPAMSGHRSASVPAAQAAYAPSITRGMVPSLAGYAAEREPLLDWHAARAESRAARRGANYAAPPQSSTPQQRPLPPSCSNIATLSMAANGEHNVVAESGAAEQGRGPKHRDEEVAALKTQVAALTALLHAGVTIGLGEILDSAPSSFTASELRVKHGDGGWAWEVVPSALGGGEAGRT